MAASGVYTMIVDVKPDLGELRATIARIESLIERLEALGNTQEVVTINYSPPTGSGEDLTRAYERLIAVINSRASSWGL